MLYSLVLVGNTEIALPVPWGCEAVRERSGFGWDVAEAATPNTYRLLELFVPGLTTGCDQSHREDCAEQYMAIEAIEGLEARRLTLTEFGIIARRELEYNKQSAELLPNARRLVGDVIDRAERRVAASGHDVYEVGLGHYVRVGVIVEHGEMVALSSLFEIRGNLEGEQVAFIFAAASILILVKGRPLAVHLHRRYWGIDDMTHVRRIAGEWGEECLSANR